MKGRRRYMGSEEPFDGFLVRGKFTDDSGPEDWCLCFSADRNQKTNIAEFVNPITKEFIYTEEEPRANMPRFLCGYNTVIEKIYRISGVENPTNLYGLFIQALSIIYIDIRDINTSNVTSFGYFVQSNTKLKELHVNWDLSSATTMGASFDNCFNLTTILGTIKNLKVSLSLKSSPLTNESAMVFINGLAEVETPQTITFSAATYATLTPEQIAIAERKNWIVAKV